MIDVSHIITRLDLGGAQQNTLYCVANHDRSRFRSHLVSGVGGRLDAEAGQIEDASVHLLPTLRHPVRPLADAAAVRVIASILERDRIDLVHTHSSKAGILGRLAARRARIPAVIHTVHGWSFNATQGALRRALYVWLERGAARLTGRIVAVAEANVRQGLEAGIGRPEQYRVIHSGIDVASFQASPGRSLIGRRPGELSIGTVACLKPQKDPLTLVRVARLVLDELPNARFFIAGDGVLRDEVERLAAELGMADRLVLLGWVDDVHAFLHELDLFLLTSRFEGLPRAVLQAVAAGVPVVSSAVDGVPEVIRDQETGRLVQPAQVADFANAALEMLRRPDEAAALAARARADLVGSFEITNMLAQLEELYLELIAEVG